jgi:hypothetical protein
VRKLILVALALTLLTGCPKKKDKAPPTPTAQTGGTGQPGVHAPTGVVVNSGGGGGSGGAVQAVRQAAKRSVTQNELKNIQTFIEAASSASGKMPTVQEVYGALQKEAPATATLVQEGAIKLTGTRSRENIWAYTAEPVSVTGEYMMVTSSSIERVTGQALNARLQQEQGR